MKTKEPQMFLQFVFEDGSRKELEVSKFTSIRSHPDSKVMLHVDQLPDGKHLLIASESILCVDDKRQITSKLKRIEIIRSP